MNNYELKLDTDLAVAWIQSNVTNQRVYVSQDLAKLRDMLDTINNPNLNRIVKAKTGFASFGELIEGQGGYRPTINVDDRELACVANAYDRVQKMRGDERRAERRGNVVHNDTTEETKPEKEVRSTAAIANVAKALAKDCISQAKRERRNDYFVHRSAEVIVVDANDERLDVDFIDVKELSGKALRECYARFAKHEPNFKTIWIQGGVDCYDTFYEFVNGGDYEPMYDTWEMEITRDDFEKLL